MALTYVVALLALGDTLCILPKPVIDPELATVPPPYWDVPERIVVATLLVLMSHSKRGGAGPGR